MLYLVELKGNVVNGRDIVFEVRKPIWSQLVPASILISLRVILLNWKIKEFGSEELSECVRQKYLGLNPATDTH